MRQTIGCAVMLVMLTAGGAHAQSVVGTWNADYVRGVRRGPEGEEVFRGTARLVIAELRGDSVFGTWTPVEPDAESRAFRGTLKDNALRVVLAPAVSTMNVNGETREVTTTVTLDGRVTGDSIKGTMLTEGLPNRAPTPREWSAVRQK